MRLKTHEGRLTMGNITFEARRNNYSAKELLKIIRHGRVCEYIFIKCCLYYTCDEALQHMKKRGYR